MVARRAEGLITIENARVLYRNFSGIEKEYNRLGDKNFCVIIPDRGVAEVMAEDGYNIKQYMPKLDDDEVADDVLGEPFVQVKVSWKGRAPEIYMIGEQTRTRNRLDESMVPLLDQVEIVIADLVVSPYNWKPGHVTAYLRKMFVVIHEDALDLKYADTLDLKYADTASAD